MAVPYVIMLMTEEWRMVAIFTGIPALSLLIIIISIFPESQKWKQGRGHINASCSSSTPWKVYYHKELFLGILLAYANNSIDPCLFYGPSILISAGGDLDTGNWAGLSSALLSFAAILVSVPIIARYSRRSVLLTTFGVVVAGYFVTAFTFAYLPSSSVTTVLIPTFAVLVAAHQCGPGVLFILIVNELFTETSSRGRSIGMTTACMSLFSVAINGTLLSTLATFGNSFSFAMYGLSFLAAWIVFYAELPETKTRVIAG